MTNAMQCRPLSPYQSVNGSIRASVFLARSALYSAVNAALDACIDDGYFAPHNGPTPSAHDIARDMIAYSLACDELAEIATGMPKQSTDDGIRRRIDAATHELCPMIHAWLAANGY